MIDGKAAKPHARAIAHDERPRTGVLVDRERSRRAGRQGMPSNDDLECEVVSHTHLMPLVTVDLRTARRENNEQRQSQPLHSGIIGCWRCREGRSWICR